MSSTGEREPLGSPGVDFRFRTLTAVHARSAREGPEFLSSQLAIFVHGDTRKDFKRMHGLERRLVGADFTDLSVMDGTRTRA